MSAKTDQRGVEKSTHLTTQVALAEGMIDTETGRLWPTPAARDWKSPGTEQGYAKRREKRQQALNEEAAWGKQSGYSGGQLNPEWVEWLMGFPIGWTDPRAEPDRTLPNVKENGEWLDEPDISRVTKTKEKRAARIKALGNAVVPQVAEFIGRGIAAQYKQGENK